VGKFLGSHQLGKIVEIAVSSFMIPSLEFVSQSSRLRGSFLPNSLQFSLQKSSYPQVALYNEQWRAEWIPVERGFTVLPRRWVVERTFAWIERYRRLSKDYEYLSNTSKTMIYLSMTKTMLNRYAKTT
jgi:hypothetical protein